VELRYYFEVIRRRIWIVVALTAIVVAGVAFQTAGRPELYSAEVTMMVSPRFSNPGAFEDPGYVTFQSIYRQTVIGNVAALIRSDTVLKRVQQRIRNVSLNQLRGAVTVEPVPETDFLTITVMDPDPARATEIANVTAEEFNRYYAEINAAGVRAEREFIAGQLQQAQTRLGTAEQALVAYKGKTGIIAPTESVAWSVRRLLDMQASEEAANLEAQIAGVRANFIRSRVGSQPELRKAGVSISANPVFASLRGNLTQLELELAAMRQVYTDQHPKVKAVLGRIADTRQRITKVAETAVNSESLGVNPIRENLVRAMIESEIDIAASRARAVGASTIAKRMADRVSQLPKTEADLARLQRDVQISESLFVRLSQLHQEALIRENKAANTAQAAIIVIDPATVPVFPVPKSVPFRAGLAGLMGLVMGSALAMLLESLDTRVRTSREAEATYGLPVLGAIPTMDARTLRQLTTAPATSVLMLSLLVAFILVGAIVAVYALQAGASTDDAVRFGQSIVQTLQGSR
jgi:uncharacterized protein involved in exopolysaccharide biosynthesis